MIEKNPSDPQSDTKRDILKEPWGDFQSKTRASCFDNILVRMNVVLKYKTFCLFLVCLFVCLCKSLLLKCFADNTDKNKSLNL